MNDAKAVELRALCDVLEEARLRFQCLGMMNTPTDSVARAEQTFAYEKARVELWAAQDAVRDFQLRMVSRA